MQSMSVERLTASSASGILRAELAAQSATEAAISELLQADSFPISAYQVYEVGLKENNSVQKVPFSAPYLTMVKPNSNWNEVDKDNDDAPELRVMASFQLDFDALNIDKANETPDRIVREALEDQVTQRTTAETVDINARFDKDEPLGWIGLADENGNRRCVPVQWIYLLDEESGKRMARYAYWIDDESARLDISQIGQNESKHERKAGGEASDISIHGFFASNANGESVDTMHFLNERKDLRDYCYGLLGWKQLVKRSEAKWNERLIEKMRESSEGTKALAELLDTVKRAFPKLTSEEQIQKLAADQLRASIAWETKPDERGSLGYRRLDINDWVDGTCKVTNRRRDEYQNATARQRLANKVIAMGHYINRANRSVFFLGDDTADFGTRYYKDIPLDGNDTTYQNRLHYGIKIAANIQDYIDEDHQPTVINHDLSGWQELPDLTSGKVIPYMPPAAFGKEVVPAIGEYVGYYHNDGTKLTVDHTFEIWNIHTKDIDFSRLANARILMGNRNPLTAGDDFIENVPGTLPEPPLEFVLPSASAPSGRYTLLSTLSSDSPLYYIWVLGNPHRIAIGPREEYSPDDLEGEIDFYMNPADGPARSGDVDTQLVIVNDYGYLDIQPRIAQQGDSNPPGKAKFGKTPVVEAKKIGTQSFGNSGPASDNNEAGNNGHRRYPLDSGDPRSFTEVWPNYDESNDARATIAWRRNVPNASSEFVRGSSTLLGAESGNFTEQSLPNYNSRTSGIIPDNAISFSTSNTIWRERVPVPEPVASGYWDMGENLGKTCSVIRGGHMKTIGELGFIYDSAISGIDNDGKQGWHNDTTRKRGGFRTLTIGSRMGEDIGPGRVAETATETQLRLTHVNEKNRASRLLELFDVFPDRQRGTPQPSPPPRVLLNSALRNPSNIPLRAVVENLNTQSSSDPVASDANFAWPVDPLFNGSRKVASENLVRAMEDDAESGRPFFYLGQLATRLDIFNTGMELFEDGFDITPKHTGESRPHGNVRQNPVVYRNADLMTRGREEVFRRLSGSLCMKGSRFRIYAIAQAGNEGRDSETGEMKFLPRNTTRLVTVVELERQYKTDDPLENTSMCESGTSCNTNCICGGESRLLLENNKPIPNTTQAKTLLQLRY